MCNKAKILRNLKGRCNPVGFHVALLGLENEDNGFADLAELVQEGKVEKQMVPHGDDKFGRPLVFPMYRAVVEYGRIEADSNGHLQLVK